MVFPPVTVRFQDTRFDVPIDPAVPDCDALLHDAVKLTLDRADNMGIEDWMLELLPSRLLDPGDVLVSCLESLVLRQSPKGDIVSMCASIPGCAFDLVIPSRWRDSKYCPSEFPNAGRVDSYLPGGCLGRLPLAAFQSVEFVLTGRMRDSHALPNTILRESRLIEFRVKTATMRTMTLCMDHNSLVEDLKHRVQCEKGIQSKQQRLVFDGRCLSDGTTLKSCGIVSRSVVHVVLILRGGMMVCSSGRTNYASLLPRGELGARNDESSVGLLSFPVHFVVEESVTAETKCRITFNVHPQCRVADLMKIARQETEPHYFRTLTTQELAALDPVVLTQEAISRLISELQTRGLPP